MQGRELDLKAILAGIDDVLPEGHRSGIVCLAGRPNVGKSTLLNAMVGEKVSIVTDVPGTTRNAIRGVVTRDDAQLVFVDTPGLAKPKALINNRLNQLVYDTWQSADVICFVLDAEAGIGQGDKFIAAELAKVDTPVICVVNKADTKQGAALLPTLTKVQALGAWTDIVPTSALEGFNIPVLIDVLVGQLGEGRRMFASETKSDQTDEQLASEIIREKFLTRVFEEVPHAIAVVVDEFAVSEDNENLLEIHANIYVERDSQKGIVIGKRGSVIQEGNKLAREELEEIFGCKVFLEVHVKVAKNWQRDPRKLARFGY